ncbi:hypothetical protein V8F33_006810 [Rhypophila sp. PSN 637]
MTGIRICTGCRYFRCNQRQLTIRSEIIVVGHRPQYKRDSNTEACTESLKVWILVRGIGVPGAPERRTTGQLNPKHVGGCAVLHERRASCFAIRFRNSGIRLQLRQQSHESFRVRVLDYNSQPVDTPPPNAPSSSNGQRAFERDKLRDWPDPTPNQHRINNWEDAKCQRVHFHPQVLNKSHVGLPHRSVDAHYAEEDPPYWTKITKYRNNGWPIRAGVAGRSSRRSHTH